MKTLLLCFALILAAARLAAEPPSWGGPQPLWPGDPKGALLPRGMPRMVDTNGNVVWIDEMFSTKAYQQAVFPLLVQEANRVARELSLPEDLPITRSNVVGAFIGAFGYNYVHRALGTITTRHYLYYMAQGNTFNKVDDAHYSQTCARLKDQRLPIELLNTNDAYQLATQWLRRVSIDVDALNRDRKCHVAVSAFWNGLRKLGDRPGTPFVPIYFVWWPGPQSEREGFAAPAYVELFAPTRTLLQLDVSDPKYILRRPLVVPNLDSLFPGTGAVTTLPPLDTRVSH